MFPPLYLKGISAPLRERCWPLLFYVDQKNVTVESLLSRAAWLWWFLSLLSLSRFLFPSPTCSWLSGHTRSGRYVTYEPPLRSGTRTASADQKAWRTHLAATSTSITAPSALNPVFFHRPPQRCDPFRITALACTRSSCFRDRIINRTVPARVHARAFFPRCLKAQRSRYFDPLSRFFSPAIIFTIWMRSSVEAYRIESPWLKQNS